MKARVRLEFRHPHQDVIDETALRQLQWRQIVDRFAEAAPEKARVEGGVSG